MKKEELAEKLHEWYLEATKELNPESYNSNAKKPYSELTEGQKFIGRYIADKIKKHFDVSGDSAEYPIRQFGDSTALISNPPDTLL